jgi:signal transduction histidine kinase
MAVKLRTRLFLVVAALLGASIGVSALLSRRATLVEVRAIVERSGPQEDPGPVLDRVVRAVRERSGDELSDVLASLQAETKRRVLVVDQARTIVAASDPLLAGATVRQLTPDGTVTVETGKGEGHGVIEIRGAPVRSVTTSDGAELTVALLPVPNPSADDLVPLRPGTPLWVWTTIATAIIAVPLVFAVSRRILRPVTALTDAAHRMQAGALDVRVDDRGRDEVADLARAFNRMAARLAETERLRKQMVSDVAHELRSPVTNLRCTLESIQDGLAVADRAAIDALHDETLFLQRLITDLEDLSRADAGQLAMRRERVEIGETIRRAAAATILPSQGVDLKLEVPTGVAAVNGDPDRLEQIFRNLLSNAARHTPAGGSIIVTARSGQADVDITIRDTGAGIDPLHLPHVFDRFYRAAESRARATGGAGLGLAIVRQLVAAHGGTVKADSAGVGKGATFVVTLPTSER